MHCPKISPKFEFEGHRLHPWVPTPQNVAVEKNQQMDVGVAMGHATTSVSKQVGLIHVSSASSALVGKSAHAV